MGPHAWFVFFGLYIDGQKNVWIPLPFLIFTIVADCCHGRKHVLIDIL